MMTEKQAQEYIEYLKKYRRPRPIPENELKYLQTFGPDTNAFTDVYGYYAAMTAESWHASHGNSGKAPTLGKCIRAANQGIILASYEYMKGDGSQDFMKFAQSYIQAELEKISQ